MKGFRRYSWVGAMLLLVAALATACAGRSEAPNPDGALVTEAVVQIQDSFPVQVEVLLSGNLPDSCTEVVQVRQDFDVDQSLFAFTIETARSDDADCDPGPVPFEETVSLAVEGLSAGVYTLAVGEIRETFTLQVDNVAPETGLPNPASVYCEEQGYRVEIRTDGEGNQYGVCVFPDGSECDEWAFFRGECGPPD